MCRWKAWRGPREWYHEAGDVNRAQTLDLATA